MNLGLYNIKDGYADAIVRGFRSGLLTVEDYNRLCNCETLEDLRTALEDTDYGSFMQDEPTPLSVPVFASRMRDKLAAEFKYIQSSASSNLNKFLDYIIREKIIDNVILIIQGLINKKPVKEILAKLDPLGTFEGIDNMLSIDIDNYDTLYKMILIDSPVGEYFYDYLQSMNTTQSQSLNNAYKMINESKDDIQIMKTILKKTWLEDFYRYTQSLDSSTAEVMKDILEAEADLRALSITFNSMNTSAPAAGTKKTHWYPSFGHFYPRTTAILMTEFDETKIRNELLPYRDYLEIFDECKQFYMRKNESTNDYSGEGIGKGGRGGRVERAQKDSKGDKGDRGVTGNNDIYNMKTVEDLLYKARVKKSELAFMNLYHYGVYYAWLILKEQEIRNICWIANMIILNRKDKSYDIVYLFNNTAGHH